MNYINKVIEKLQTLDREIVFPLTKILELKKIFKDEGEASPSSSSPGNRSWRKLEADLTLYLTVFRNLSNNLTFKISLDKIKTLILDFDISLN